VQVKISVRHGHLSEATQKLISDKAEGLLHLFDRLTMIEATVDLHHNSDGRCSVEFVVQAEHKHEGLVARESHADLLVAVDQALHKLESQLRRYKGKIQDHRRDPSAGEVAGALQPETNTEE
jgi:putative sigma-54 modulation protein